MVATRRGAANTIGNALLTRLRRGTGNADFASCRACYARPRVRIMKVSKAYSLSCHQGSTSLR
jgi:hypothetical protein